MSFAFETGGRLDPYRVCPTALPACSFSVSVGPGKSEGGGGRLVHGRVTRRGPAIILGNIKTLVPYLGQGLAGAIEATECGAIVLSW